MWKSIQRICLLPGMKGEKSTRVPDSDLFARKDTEGSSFVWKSVIAVGYGVVAKLFVFSYFTTNVRNTGLVGKGAIGVWKARLRPAPPVTCPHERPIWLQIAGPGDARAAEAFLRELSANAPNCPVYLTYGTRPAREYIHAHPEAFAHCASGWFPFDIPFVWRRMLRRLQPRVFVSMQGEFWPALLKILHQTGVPTIALRVDIFDWDEQSEFPRCIKALYLDMLSRVSAFSVRDPVYGDRLLRYGVPSERIWYGGDYRMEVLPSFDDSQQAKYQELLCVNPERPFVVWAGPRLDELRMLEPYLRPQVLQGSFRLLIAPAEIDACAGIESLLHARGYPLWKRSSEGRPAPNAILILDTHGELFHIYSVADLMISGDSFYSCRSEGRNFWEALIQGTPVAYGARVPVTALTSCVEDAGVARRVTAPALLPDTVASFLQARPKRSDIRSITRAALAQSPKVARTDVVHVLDCIARNGAGGLH